jgi:hypothetical protein
MGRLFGGAEISKTFEASEKLVVPEVPIEIGSCVSPIGTTADVDVVVEIETHGRLQKGWVIP